MASQKTDFLQLNDWAGTDPIKREELNGNFRKIDTELKNQDAKFENVSDQLETVQSGLAEMSTKQGELIQLNTTDKSSFVNAIKEIKTQANTKADQTALSDTNANLSNLQTQVTNMGSGSPKGTYATLTDLQTAFPTGNTNIYVVTADGKWYFWNGSAWTAGGTYQSTGVGDKTLTNNKLKLPVPTLLPQTFVFTSGTINTSNGSNITYTSECRTDFIKVSNGDLLTLADKTNTKFWVARYSYPDKVFIGVVNGGGWKTADMTFDGDYYIRIVQSYTAASVITDFDFFGNNIYLTNGKTASTKEYVDYLQSLINKTAIVTPSGFSWTDHPLVGKVWKDGEGKYQTTFEVSSLQVTGKTYYVDGSAGNDSNDGLTPNTALATILAAYNKSDVKVIILSSTRFSLAGGFNGTLIDKEITIKTRFGTRATLVNSAYPTWYKTTGKTNVYERTQANTVKVVDTNRKDSLGEYIVLKKVNSIDECDITADSYFINGSNVYVNVGGAANSNVLPITNSFTIEANFTTPKTIYLENIDVLGGFKATGGTVYAKNCNFKYGGADDSYSVVNGISVTQNCQATHATNDGFNYDGAKAIEIDCIGRFNGDGSESIDNGSTGHTSSRIIRLNSEYHNNIGPNVADVQGSESWNIGCNSHDSKALAATQQCDFQTQDSGTKMWVEGCKGYNTLYSLRTSNASKMYVKGGVFNTYSRNDTSTIDEY
jgi:hypothetical protein